MQEIRWVGPILPIAIGNSTLLVLVGINNRKEEWKMKIKIERSNKEKIPKKKKERVVSVG
ncbi:conjugal transfer protein, partial [Enterococcus faecium]|nr:conjugal transfer protein [Enterococcus faecium]